MKLPRTGTKLWKILEFAKMKEFFCVHDVEDYTSLPHSSVSPSISYLTANGLLIVTSMKGKCGRNDKAHTSWFLDKNKYEKMSKGEGYSISTRPERDWSKDKRYEGRHRKRKKYKKHRNNKPRGVSYIFNKKNEEIGRLKDIIVRMVEERYGKE